MNARKTLTRLLPISLTLGLLVACDAGADAGSKTEAKPAAKAADEAKPAEKPEEAAPEEEKPEEKPEEAAAEEEKPEEAAAEEEKPEEAAAEEEEKPEEEEAPEQEAPAKADPKPKAPKPKAKADDAKDEPAAGGANGKEIYLKKCKSCHGTTGAADTKIAQKHDIGSWKEPGWKSKWSLSKVRDIVVNGKSGTKMKAFKDKLTPAEIDAVSTYARSLGK